MAVAVPMTMSVESVGEMAEAAISHALASRDGAPVQAVRHFAKESRTAVTVLGEAHGYGADGPAPHHGQDDAARAFHMGPRAGSLLWIVAGH